MCSHDNNAEAKHEATEKEMKSRRDVIKSAASASILGMSAQLGLSTSRRAEAAQAKPKFLIVFSMGGAASILDSFMAMKATEVSAQGGNPASLNCFDETNTTVKTKVSQPIDANGNPVASDLRAATQEGLTHSSLGNLPIDTSNQQAFLNANYKDMLVVPWFATSVNHSVAQHRSITGNDAWNGRTLQEVAALTYGASLPIPNLNLGTEGFAQPGIDHSIAEYAKNVAVTDALYFALGLSATSGLPGAPSAGALELARKFRNQRLEQASPFFKTFANNPAMKRWLNQRNQVLADYEGQNLVQRLSFLEGEGIKPSQGALDIRSQFSDFANDPLDAKAIVALLAITSGISSVVTLGTGFTTVTKPTAPGTNPLTGILNTPIGFDLSHQNHRETQAMQWNRALKTAGRMIEFLKKTPYGSSGETYWDHSVIYFATDFGRDRIRPEGSPTFSTGHNLENAALIVSPSAKGNSALGGIAVSPTGNDLKFYGFNRSTGAKDPSAPIATEKELYTSVLTLLDVDTTKMPGAPKMGFVKRS
jgi:hypothetical protein